MNTSNPNQLLENLKTITSTNLNFVEINVEGLNSIQMQWSLGKDAWNITQVLAHLNVYSTYYQRVIGEKIKFTKHKQPLDVFNSSPLGKSVWSSVKLGNMKNIKRRVRTPRMYNPLFNSNLVLGTEVVDFIKFQKEMIELLNHAAKVNLRKIRIPVLLTKFITLRLGDALLFHVYHTERHIEQINKILVNPKFPR